MGEFFSLFFGGAKGPPPTRAPLCPDCQQPLQDVAKGRGCHRCARCQGLWLTESAFSWMLEAGEDKLESILQGSTGEHTFQRSAQARQCAVCPRPMENYPFGYKSGVWIDGCPDHHGIWLDGGELRLIRDFQRRSQGPLSSEDRARMAAAFLDGATQSRRNVAAALPKPSRYEANYDSDLGYGSYDGDYQS